MQPGWKKHKHFLLNNLGHLTFRGFLDFSLPSLCGCHATAYNRLIFMHLCVWTRQNVQINETNAIYLQIWYRCKEHHGQSEQQLPINDVSPQLQDNAKQPTNGINFTHLVTLTARQLNVSEQKIALFANYAQLHRKVFNDTMLQRDNWTTEAITLLSCLVVLWRLTK